MITCITGAVPPTTLVGIPTVPFPTERLNIHRGVAPDLSTRKPQVLYLKADEKRIVSGHLGLEALDMPSVL
jgi:hypothetical protein